MSVKISHFPSLKDGKFINFLDSVVKYLSVEHFFEYDDRFRASTPRIDSWTVRKTRETIRTTIESDPIRRACRHRLASNRIDSSLRNRFGCFRIKFKKKSILVFYFVMWCELVPCSMTRCHDRASKCVNHPFYAECICDFGFNGNGREFCDGKQNINNNKRNN